MTSTTPLLHTSTIHHPPTPSSLKMQAEGVFLLSPPFSACHQPLCHLNREWRGSSYHYHSLALPPTLPLCKSQAEGVFLPTPPQLNCTGMKQRRTVGTKGVPTFFSFSFCLIMWQGGSQGDSFSPGAFDANMKGSVGYHNDGQAYKVCLQFLSVSLYLTNPHYNR